MLGLLMVFLYMHPSYRYSVSRFYEDVSVYKKQFLSDRHQMVDRYVKQDSEIIVADKGGEEYLFLIREGGYSNEGGTTEYNIYSFGISDVGAIILTPLTTLRGYEKQGEPDSFGYDPSANAFLFDWKQNKNIMLLAQKVQQPYCDGISKTAEECVVVYTLDISGKEVVQPKRIATIPIEGNRDIWNMWSWHLIDNGDAFTLLSEVCDDATQICGDSVVHIISTVNGEEVERYALGDVGRSKHAGIMLERPRNNKVLEVMNYHPVDSKQNADGSATVTYTIYTVDRKSKEITTGEIYKPWY